VLAEKLKTSIFMQPAWSKPFTQLVQFIACICESILQNTDEIGASSAQILNKAYLFQHIPSSAGRRIADTPTLQLVAWNSAIISK